VFVFESPLGFLGELANKLVLIKYMTELLAERNRVIKVTAETVGKSKDFIGDINAD